MPAKTRTFAPIIADVTGATLISDGRLARACSWARIYARARHSGQMLSGYPPGGSSRPQLTQLAMNELYTRQHIDHALNPSPVSDSHGVVPIAINERVLANGKLWLKVRSLCL